ncbi:MAG: small basic family protein [Peptostreptococcaceae bacterium]|nr:small basic family protein [Peptostreptococcaceae bacterium]
MIIALIGLVLGVVVGYYIPITYPESYSLYISIGILASMDSILGGTRAMLENRFDRVHFFSGLISNAILAACIAYLGDKLAVPLYYAPIVVFGGRLFKNFSYIRNMILAKYIKNK